MRCYSFNVRDDRGSSFRFKRAVGSLLTLALMPMLVSATGCTAKGHRVVLPDGYVGWVRVDFRAPGGAPLPEEDGFAVIVVPESGIVETSSDIRTSPAQDEVYVARAGGKVRAPYVARGITESQKDGRGLGTWWVFFGPEDAIHGDAVQRKADGHWIPEG